MATVAALPGSARAQVAAPTGIAGPSSDLTASIETYAGDPTTSNADAMDTALSSFRSSTQTNATITSTPGARQDVTGTQVVYAATGTTITYGGLTASQGGAINVEDEGALYIGSAKASLADAGATSSIVFRADTASLSGGAIQNAGTVTLADSDFISNSAMIGGAIANNGDVTIADSDFSKNNVSYFGGAIYSDGGLTIAGSTFTANSANFAGGAIYNTEATATVVDSSFQGNSSETGGAISNYGTLIVTNGDFAENTATSDGGAIFNYATATVSDSTFSGNSAESLGGAIYSAGALTITDSNFTGNAAGTHGGAIFAEGGTLNLNVGAGSTATFSGNTADGVASSIYSEGDTAINVDVGEGGTLDMRDPMSGSSAVITKTGTGTWKLGGDNAFTAGSGDQSTTFDVAAGTLYLYAQDEVANGGETGVGAGTITLSHADSGFTLGDAATLIAGGDNSITTDGTITLGDGATIQGGTSMNEDDETLTNLGGTTSLTLTAPGGVQLEGSLKLVSFASEDVFTLNADLTDADEFAGSVNVTGNGTVRLTGDSTYTGGTAIFGGTLLVDGSITSPTSVYSGGTLGGSGTVGTTLVSSGGTLSPGNSIGTLTIDGDLTLASGATYAVEVSADGTSDLTHVTGTAALDGTLALSTVAASEETSNGRLVGGASYRILTADEGITGNFSHVTGGQVSTFLSLSNDPTIGGGQQGDDYYVVVVARADYNIVATNPNQAAVANGLEGIIGSAGTDDTIARIDYMTAAQAVTLFDQTSPEAYGAYASALQDQGELFTRQIAQHLTTLGNTGADDGKASLWGNGYGQWGKGSNDGYRHGSDQTIYGVVGGVDFGRKALRLGVAGGYSRDKVRYLPGTSDGKSKSWQVGGYASFSGGPLHVDAQIAYVHGDIDATKTIAAGSAEDDTLIAGTADASTKGHVFKGIATVGYDFGRKALLMEPYVGVDVTRGKVNGFTETGMDVLDLTVDDIHAGRTDVLAGVKVAAKVMGVTPYLNAQFKYRVSEQSRNVTAYFDDVPGAAFTVSPIMSGRWQVDLNAGVAATIGAHSKVFVGYEGIYRDEIVSHGVNGGVSIGF